MTFLHRGQNERWALSAPATLLLLELRADGRSSTASSSIARLAVKELLLRGGIEVTSHRRRSFRSDQVRVSKRPIALAGVPPVIARLHSALEAHDEELARVIATTRRRHRKLFSTELVANSWAELEDMGLVETRQRRRLGVFTTTSRTPTNAGLARAEDARRRLIELSVTRRRTERAGPAAVDDWPSSLPRQDRSSCWPMGVWRTQPASRGHGERTGA